MPAIKPPFPIAVGQVDLGNWRLAGARLVGFWPFNTPINSENSLALSGSPESVNNVYGQRSGQTVSVTPDALQVSGRCVFTPGTATGKLVYNSSSYQQPLPVGILARIKLNSASVINPIFSSSWTNAGNHKGASLYISAANKLVCAFGDNTSNSNASTTARRFKTGTTTLAAGQYYDLACVIRGATDMSLYVNSVDDGGAYSGTGGAISNASAAAAVGHDNGFGTPALTGCIDYVMELVPATGASDIDVTVIQALQFDPWALVAETNAVPWLSKRRIPRFSAIAAAGVNVSLSGVTATGAVGTLTPNIGVALAGVAGTGAVGTLSVTGTATVALSGVAGTGVVGALTPSGALTLSGVSASGAVGSFSITGDATISLSGVTGAGAVGTLSPSGAATVVLSGVAASAVVGSFSADLSIALAGVAGTGVVGSLDAAIVVELAGVSATGAVRSFGASVGVTLEGVAGTGTVAAFVPFIIPPAFDQFSLMRDNDVDCAAFMSDEGVAALGPITLEDDFTLMRSLPVASRGAMSDAGMAALGAMADDLDLFALMRSTPVAAFGLMRGTPVAARGAMP